MTDGPVRHLFWQVADELYYLLTLARLSPDPGEAAHPRRAGRSRAGDPSRSTLRTRADGKSAINR
jgi:hypothetical protein